MEVHTRGIQRKQKLKNKLSKLEGKDNQDLDEVGIRGGGLDDAIGSIGGTV